MTEIVEPDDAGIARASALLLAGQLVAFPTETVYGLGADATNTAATEAIFKAKGRPTFNPLIVHVHDVWSAEQLLRLPRTGWDLARAFWPGPLTIVAPMAPGVEIAPPVTAGLQTLAVRVPGHPLAKELLRAVGRPIAAPSANPSGRISPTTAQHVQEGLTGKVAAILDGGPCVVGLESTIIGFDGELPQLLRPGGIEIEALTRHLGKLPELPVGHTVTAPGQLASHYAPRAPIRLDAEAPLASELWLGFGAGPPGLSLSPSGDLREAAANLFACLRLLDSKATDGQVIAVARIPDEGLGVAINDRLRRAAAPRQI